MWPYEKMPDPMGGKRLLDYDCKVKFKKSTIIKPRKIRKPDDFRPGTKKGKLDTYPIWLVEIQMPKSLIADIYSGYRDDIEQPAQEVKVASDTQPADEVAAEAPAAAPEVAQ
jgi:hypothetical protein